MNEELTRKAAAIRGRLCTPPDPELERAALIARAALGNRDATRELEHDYRKTRPFSSGRKGGYNAGYRCRACYRFVSGRDVRCSSCGQEHGGVHGDAIASR